MKNEIRKSIITAREIEYIIADHKNNDVVAWLRPKDYRNQAKSIVDLYNSRGITLTQDELVKILKDNFNTNVPLFSERIADEAMLQAGGDISNDPRFFTDEVYESSLYKDLKSLRFNEIMALPVLGDLYNSIKNIKLLKSFGFHSRDYHEENALLKPYDELLIAVKYLSEERETMFRANPGRLIYYEFEKSIYENKTTKNPMLNIDRLNNLKVVEDLKNNSNELLFNPSNTKLTLREDEVEDANKDVLNNTKSVVNNFIEVPVVINND